MTRSRFIFVLLLVGLLTSPGCNRYNVPKGFPKPDKMAEILTDIHIIESTLTYSHDPHATRESNIPGHYKYILDKHGITPQEFDTIRKWYVSNPQLLNLVYDKVLTRLSKKEADVRILFERDRERELLLADQEKDSLARLRESIWKKSTSITVNSKDTLDNRVPFSFDIDSLYLSGIIRLSAYYKFLKEDASRTPRIMLSVFYPDSTADTIYKKIPHSFTKTMASLDLSLSESQSPERVYGYLLYHDSLSNVSVEITDISLRHIPADTISVEIPLHDPGKLNLEEVMR
jgi:hypothetical protein